MSTTGCCRGLTAKACIARPYGCSDNPPPHVLPSADRGKTENIRRAERKEEEARQLMREAAYLRDLDKRLAAAKLTSPDNSPTDDGAN